MVMHIYHIPVLEHINYIPVFEHRILTISRYLCPHASMGLIWGTQELWHCDDAHGDWRSKDQKKQILFLFSYTCTKCFEGVDEDGCITMLFSRNRKASVIYSGKAAGGHNSATIRGTKGKIHVSIQVSCLILSTAICLDKALPFYAYNYPPCKQSLPRYKSLFGPFIYLSTYHMYW